jgi:nucleoside-diphosphate-sugar epimerase
MARVLIAGCGWLGGALGTALAARGDAVWGLRRNAALLPDGIGKIAADLDDPRAVADALPGALDAVVYAAAPDAGDEASYHRTYVRGLDHVIAALRPSIGTPAVGLGAEVFADGDDEAEGDDRRGHRSHPRVILLSSTSVYGQTAGEWVDESSPTEPADFRGRLVLRGEAALRASGLPAIALRLGGLYGPGRASLIDAVRAGRAGVVPGPPRYTNRIHRDDAVGAVLHLLALPASAAAPVYVAVDQESADRNDVVRWLAQQLGVAPPTQPAGLAGDRASRGDTSKRCSSALLRASGYRFRYPSYREGYAALLAALPHP